MCGFLITKGFAISDDEFSENLRLLEHRGPDHQASYSRGEWCLGHTRLKILDLNDRSNQPFLSSDGRYVMVYNGEVYNYREIALRHGFECKTSGDTEVLMLLYEKLGARMLNELNGMFSIVVLDTVTGGYFVARDRLGIKPLYYSNVGERLVVSSEIAPILEILEHVRFDDIGLRQYAKLRSFFNGRTAYKNISLLESGCYIENGRKHRYWQLPRGEQEPPEDDELRELIESAVRLRCLSDVDVGCYLSGGVDSTIVSGLANRKHTWTVGFEGYNEFNWAREVAAQFGVTHHEVLVNRGEFKSLAESMIRQRKEPLSVPNEVLLFKMTEAVKQKNTVVLSGEGADELFFGYDRIFRWAEDAEGWDVRAFNDYYSYGRHDDMDIVEDALAPFVVEGASCLEIVARFFQVGHLHGLLRRLDNATMRCSVEARVPFVDHRLVERMAGVAMDYRMMNGEVKAPLKRVFSDFLPESIRLRKKIGFPVPLEEIFFGRETDLNGPDAMALDYWLKFNLEILTGEKLDIADIGITP